MIQHFGDKHSPVFSDELQGSIRLPIDQVLANPRGCSRSVQTLGLYMALREPINSFHSYVHWVYVKTPYNLSKTLRLNLY